MWKARAAASAGGERFAVREAGRSPPVPVRPLRASEEGRARTPDIVLRVPVGVRDRAGRVRVVWWIDSKAYFGPPLAGNTARQLDAYVSRYGPGLVVHWFGFVEGSGGGGGGGGGPWKEDVLVSDRLPLPLLHVEP